MKDKSRITYFKIGKDEAVYPAKSSIRLFARIFDYLIAILPGALLTSIYVSVISPTISGQSIQSSAELAGIIEGQAVITASQWNIFLEPFMYSIYDFIVLTGQSIMIIGIILFLIIIPLMNKKNIGQTIGKRLFKITPIYLSNKSERYSFVKRELFVAGPLILMITFSMIGGVSGNAQLSVYQRLTNYTSDDVAYKDGVYAIGQLPSTNSQIKFFLEIYSNPTYFNGSKQVAILLIVNTQIYIVIIIYLIVLFFTTLFSSQKKGMHDLVAKTSVVDLKSIVNINEANNLEEKMKSLDEPPTSNSENSYGPRP